MSRVQKVCPVVLRGAPGAEDILAFVHPLAGLQLVKGTLEAGETPLVGALRELEEEAGICGAAGAGPVWESKRIAEGQIWHFVPIAVPVLPQRFSFETADDGGHVFAFFWWPLAGSPGPEWHEIFVLALAEIRSRA